MENRLRTLLKGLHSLAVELVLLTLLCGESVSADPTRSGIVYWHGDHKNSWIALTFDDGPEPPFTSQILEVLKENNVKATFFLIGQNVETYPGLARSIVLAGHAIGNHTYTHHDMIREPKDKVDWQLERSEKAIQRATGLKPKIYRPPYGDDNAMTLHESERLGYVTVKWSVSSDDWTKPGVEAIVSKVLPHVANGSIILMHDGGKDRSQTVEAVKILIPELKKKGFWFVTIPELLNIKE